MKTFNQFKHDMNEGVAALAIPVGAGILKKIAASSALKAIGSGALTGGALTGAYLASKKINKDKGEEEIQQRKQAEDEEVGKAIGKNPGEKLPPVRKRDIIKQEFQKGFRQYKKGLSVKPEDVKGKKYRTPEMKGKSPAQFVKDLIIKQSREFKKKQIKNKKIDRDLGK